MYRLYAKAFDVSNFPKIRYISCLLLCTFSNSSNNAGEKATAATLPQICRIFFFFFVCVLATTKEGKCSLREKLVKGLAIGRSRWIRYGAFTKKTIRHIDTKTDSMERKIRAERKAMPQTDSVVCMAKQSRQTWTNPKTYAVGIMSSSLQINLSPECYWTLI